MTWPWMSRKEHQRILAAVEARHVKGMSVRDRFRMQGFVGGLNRAAAACQRILRQTLSDKLAA